MLESYSLKLYLGWAKNPIFLIEDFVFILIRVKRGRLCELVI